jgi:hypothetical protein
MTPQALLFLVLSGAVVQKCAVSQIVGFKPVEGGKTHPKL